jgi:sucrose-phosphate phosphatase subfamily
MKIYYASQSFYPHIGGVSTYLLNLAKQMIKKGNEVVEVHLRPSGEGNQDEIKGIEIHKVPKEPIDKEIMQLYSKFKEAVYKGSHYNKNEFNKPACEMLGYAEFYKVNEYFGEQIRDLLKQNPADVVHIHDFQLLFAYKYVPRGTPCILTWHIPFIENMSKQLSEFLIRHMNEYDKVVFSSQEYIDAAIKLGLKKEKIELIYPMANTDLFERMDIDKKSVFKKYDIPQDSKTILCVQRVDPKSGHEQLVKALSIVKKEIPNAKLIFVGAESLSNKLSKDREKLFNDVKKLISELNLEDDIIFTGNIDYNVLPELYNSVDVVSLCSKNEGFGLAITEGMSCGKPIIGTKVGGIPIQVRDGYNGYLVEVGDYKKTADSIIKILKDDNLKQTMENNSLEMVNNNFKIEVGVEKHLVLYNKIINSKDEFHKLKYIDKTDIKGIVTDLDRTITDKAAKEYFDPIDFDKKMLKELSKLGYDLFLATGRNIHYVKKLCAHFKKTWRCVIAENGAVIYFPNTKKTITFNTYYMKRVKKIVRNLNLKGTTIGKVITSNKITDIEFIKNKIGNLFDKVEFIVNADEFMILPKGVEKGIGIKIAMNYLQKNMDKLIFIGDGDNDCDMFMNSGFKIALSNATDKLKSLANQVTKNPSTKGIYEIISELKEN